MAHAAANVYLLERDHIISVLCPLERLGGTLNVLHRVAPGCSNLLHAKNRINRVSSEAAHFLHACTTVTVVPEEILHAIPEKERELFLLFHSCLILIFLNFQAIHYWSSVRMSESTRTPSDMRPSHAPTPKLRKIPFMVTNSILVS